MAITREGGGQQRGGRTRGARPRGGRRRSGQWRDGRWRVRRRPGGAWPHGSCATALWMAARDTAAWGTPAGDTAAPGKSAMAFDVTGTGPGGQETSPDGGETVPPLTKLPPAARSPPFLFLPPCLPVTAEHGWGGAPLVHPERKLNEHAAMSRTDRFFVLLRFFVLMSARTSRLEREGLLLD